jgi:hypothetical protein
VERSGGRFIALHELGAYCEAFIGKELTETGSGKGLAKIGLAKKGKLSAATADHLRTGHGMQAMSGQHVAQPLPDGCQEMQTAVPAQAPPTPPLWHTLHLSATAAWWALQQQLLQRRLLGRPAT